MNIFAFVYLIIYLTPQGSSTPWVLNQPLFRVGLELSLLSRACPVALPPLTDNSPLASPTRSHRDERERGALSLLRRELCQRRKNESRRQLSLSLSFSFSRRGKWQACLRTITSPLLPLFFLVFRLRLSFIPRALLESWRRWTACVTVNLEKSSLFPPSERSMTIQHCWQRRSHDRILLTLCNALQHALAENVLSSSYHSSAELHVSVKFHIDWLTILYFCILTCFLA